MAERTSWATWSRLMLWAQGMVAGLGLVALGLAVALAVADESSHDDEWDGLGTFIAMFVGAIALAVLVTSVVLLLVTWRARRRAECVGSFGSLRAVAIITAVLAAGWLTLCLSQVALGAMRLEPLGLVLSIPAVLALIPAVGSLGAIPKRPGWARDNPS